MRVGPALADRYRVYALDMRGHGESFKPPRGTYSLRRTADDAFGGLKLSICAGMARASRDRKRVGVGKSVI